MNDYEAFKRLDNLLSAVLAAQSRLDAKPWLLRVWDVTTRQTEKDVKQLILSHFKVTA